jgi:imidazolonepropionase-like amidohydrolase
MDQRRDMISKTKRLLRRSLIGVVLMAGCGIAEAQTVVIHAGTLIATPGSPARTNQSIVVENGRITSIVDGFVAGDQIIDLSKSYVLPGLIDMHTHVVGMEKIDETAPSQWVTNLSLQRQSITVLKAIPVVRQILLRGFTTIRNVGDPASVTYDLRDAIASGKVEGPRMLVSEPQFTLPGGALSNDVFHLTHDAAALVGNRGACTGVEDCRRAVREEVQRGADVIKLRLADTAALDPRIQTIESQDEVNAIVETAHQLGRTVAVHTSGVDRETMLAVNAGADTIEHGPQSDAVLLAMKRKGLSFTPTLDTYRYFAPILKRLGITRDYYGEARASVGDAKRIGVRILYGTDLMPLYADRQSREFSALVDAGLTPSEALMAATVNAAAALHMEKEIGSIAPGKAADIIAVDQDPTRDIQAMEKVSFVMKAGKVVTPKSGD